jgi:GTP 3',8-cyclase
MQRPPLIDRFGRRHTYLRISVTDRCNFRCVYCMPEEGLEWRDRDELLSYEEILRVSRLFAEMGIDKVRITGGEPTVRRDLDQLIAGLRDLPGIERILMTTNGTTLEQLAQRYRQAGLDGLNVSLDSLRPERFAQITRSREFDRVMRGLDRAVEVGFDPVKVNVVVMAGVNDDEIGDFVEFARTRPVNVRFIEFMPFQGNGWDQGSVFTYAQMRKVIERTHALRPIGTEDSAVAKEFSIDGFAGSIGFVTSMTENFCSTCNRVRLTAEGSVKACLFSPEEVDVRSPLREGASDELLVQRIRDAIQRKWKGHPGMNQLPQVENRSMIRIGG